ncbi:hypothetical protein K8374_04030 [Pseudomonas sp. p1(2021b)]|uniref:hypothetical protein n=1 Tax=Pseudomonas sp. p1(2021b) TaxID=2874628 RepID=UPI001CCABDEB|nr:hypothetical protein [Pseudomonas sp. p1(2021b)]UBM26175.1 hypothetical protein K8374_04030 [Pseudomonas sp. p1(2021b)]
MGISPLHPHSKNMAITANCLMGSPSIFFLGWPFVLDKLLSINGAEVWLFRAGKILL